MVYRVLKIAALCLLPFVVGHVAATEVAVASAPPVQIKEIALAPTLEPAKITIENRGGAAALFALPGFLVQRDIEKSRRAEFQRVLKENSLNLGEELTTALRLALVEGGQPVVGLDEIKYVSDDPRVLEYKMLKSSADLVLSADIFDVGLYSGQFSRRYLPRLNVTFDLVNRHTEDSVYSQSIYYGADAKKSTDDQIPSDPQYAFDSYEQAMERRREIVDALREGIKKMALLVAKQVREARK